MAAGFINLSVYTWIQEYYLLKQTLHSKIEIWKQTYPFGTLKYKKTIILKIHPQSSLKYNKLYVKW